MSNKQQSNRNNQFPFAFQSLMDANANFLENATEQSAEVARFFGQRLNEYAEMPQRLAGCKQPQDFFDLQSAFFEKMFTDYREEAQTLFSMASKLTQESYQQVDGKHYEKSLLKAQEHASELIEQGKQQAQHIIEDAEARAKEIVTKAKAASKGKAA